MLLKKTESESQAFNSAYYFANIFQVVKGLVYSKMGFIIVK